MFFVLILCCSRIGLQIPYFWSSAEDDSSVTMLAVISGHQLHTHLFVAGGERRQTNIGVVCEMQTFDVEECGEKCVQRRNAADESTILSHPPENGKKSSLCKPALASTI